VENRFTGELQAAGGFGVDGWVQLAPEEWGPTGGRYLNGTAGTIYLRGPDHDYGELIIDNADLEPNGIATPLVAATIRSGTGTVDASGEIVTTDQVIYSDASGLTFGHIGRQVIIDGDLSNPLTVVEHGRDWMRLNRALRPESTVVYQGAFFFDSVTIRRKAWVTTLGERLIVPGGEPDVEEGSMLE
jgi:hypothetical protein